MDPTGCGSGRDDPDAEGHTASGAMPRCAKGNGQRSQAETPRSASHSVLVKRFQPRAVAFPDRMAADLETRSHLAGLDRERLVGEGELADFLDHREVLVDP